jgi:hypothetical protein
LVPNRIHRPKRKIHAESARRFAAATEGSQAWPRETETDASSACWPSPSACLHDHTVPLACEDPWVTPSFERDSRVATAIEDVGCVSRPEHVAAAHLAGQRLIVSALCRALEDAAHLGQQVSPASGKFAEFGHRDGLLGLGEVALLSHRYKRGRLTVQLSPG